MVECPESIREIISKAATKFRDDIKKAVKGAEEQIVKCEEFEEFKKLAVTRFVRELIHDSRSQQNGVLRAQLGHSGPSKSGLSEVTAQVAMISVFHHCIDGRSLGSILGTELACIRDACGERAKGELFNAGLVEALMPLVPADKRVDQAVTEAKLRKIYQTIQSGVPSSGLKPKPRMGRREKPEALAMAGH